MTRGDGPNTSNRAPRTSITDPEARANSPNGLEETVTGFETQTGPAETAGSMSIIEESREPDEIPIHEDFEDESSVMSVVRLGDHPVLSSLGHIGKPSRLRRFSNSRFTPNARPLMGQRRYLKG